MLGLGKCGAGYELLPRGNSQSRQQHCKHVANDAVALVVVAANTVAVVVVVFAIDIAEMRRQLGTGCASLVAPAAVALAALLHLCRVASWLALLPRRRLLCFYLYGRRQPAMPDTLSGPTPTALQGNHPDKL